MSSKEKMFSNIDVSSAAEGAKPTKQEIMLEIYGKNFF
jgi:hypothetical protein